MLSTAEVHKKNHASAKPLAWSPLLRFPTVVDVPRTVDDEQADYQRRLGAAIVELRTYRGLSQATLASEIGRSEPTLSRWETGKSQPSTYDLMRLCQILEAPAELLVFPPERPVSPVAARLAALRSVAAAEAETERPKPISGGAPIEGAKLEGAHD